MIRKYLRPADGFEIRFRGGNPFHHRRRYADGELIFIVNSSMDEAASGELTIEGKALLEMDAESGGIYAFPATSASGRLTASFRIEPAGSLTLYCSSRSKPRYPARPPTPESALTVQAAGETTITRMKDNAMAIDFCDITVKGQTHRNVHCQAAADIVYRAHGFANGNPWNTSVQYKRNILDRDNFTDGGFAASYHFTVNDVFDRSSMQLVAERPELFTVKINGETVRPTPGQWRLDPSFGVYPIGTKVVEGRNTVELSISPMSVFAEVEPVYLFGDFSVVAEAEGWSIGAPVERFAFGSWKEQRQPFYSWDFKYGKTIHVTEIPDVCLVRLGKWAGTVAEVRVNGAKAGVIAYDPYHLDVASHIKEGENRIDVHVIGSMKNLFGPHYRNPDPGIASPWHWKNITEAIPGAEYQMMDYGLMEDFRIETGKRSSK